MDDLVAARMLHVIGVVLWIGGVALVTTVVLPEARRRADTEEKLKLFEWIEHRFGRQVRWITVLTGLTGLYMTYRLDLWNRFAMPEFWWMHAMVGVWLVFTVIIFLMEPWFLSRWFRRFALNSPERAFSVANWMHRLLLFISLLTIAGAIAGAHG